MNQTASPVMNQTATPVTNQTETPVTNQTATPVTTVSAPAKVAQINLGFSMDQEFKDIYSDLSNTETKELSNSIINECSRVYKRRFPKFYRMFIRKFSKGSVVVDSVLEFDSTNGTSPNVTDVKDTLVTAVTNGNFNFTINNSSINTTDIPETSGQCIYRLIFFPVRYFNNTCNNSKYESNCISSYESNCHSSYESNCISSYESNCISSYESNCISITNQTASPVTNQTASPVTNQTASPVTNQTASPVTSQTATPVTTVSAPAKVAQINLGFRIDQEFKDIYSDLSNTETKELSNSIINECSRVYKRRFPKFYRMFILKFSKGSVVVDSVLEFDSTNGTSPNVTDVKDTLVTAVTNGNFNFTINNSSINTTDIPETSG
ncbi:uncharacterized protein LOC130084905 [Rhinichthys klamathensis goyatoka]|uniref:uncharacterized protein LOC130084905 n=1 Tax=Rhinichthys klamathensis goyatoka TaxID=3034132 RepID=UPI0024B4FC1D|nr:uncharacterized protein LOC130084905 [Rhinichthys klamathensis goyatoka]